MHHDHGASGPAAALRAALAPLPAPWAVGPALRAVAAAVLVLAGSVLLADLTVGGIAYLGVACAVSFIGRGDYRSRAANVGAQAAGAAAGMTVGALVPDTAPWVIAAATVVGVLAGMLGRIGPGSTGGAVMAVIGVAYTQFGRLAMPWWEPVLAYLTGSALVLALGLAGASWHRDRPRRAAVAAVLDAAADLLETARGADAEQARHRLALASAAARVAVAGYRVRPVTGPVAAAWWAARDAAAAAAAHGVAPVAEEAETSRAWRTLAREVRDGSPGRFPSAPPVTVPAVGTVLRAATTPAALWVGARVGSCVGIATALAILLHPPQHAFWIPLTVAVVLRPEYGAVLVRSVHRLAGTVLGVAGVAALLTLTSSPEWLIVGAALALGAAALVAPRWYGLAVVGITGSALLSIAVGDPQGVEPWARLLDTVLGCAVALVFGVLLWPRRGLPDQSRVFAAAAATLRRQIDLLRPDAPEAARAAGTDEAYRLAHGWRAELERGLAEPDPARAAAAWLPVAMQLERTVDVAAATGVHSAAAMVALRSAEHEPVTTPAEASDLLARVAADLAPRPPEPP